MLLPVGDQWNDSLDGDDVWSAGNVAEAIPDVMSPATWSAFQHQATQAVGPRFVAGHPLWGTIGGRFYFNVTVTLSLAARLASTAVIAELTEQSLGPLPPQDEIPLLALPRWQAFREAGLREFAVGAGAVARRRALRSQIGAMPERCERAVGQVAAATTPAELAEVWNSVIEPLYAEACGLMRYARPEAMRQALYHRALRRLAGAEHANTITTDSDPDRHLASLDLVLALEDLRAGRIERSTFVARFGHRGPHEYELSMPAAADDPEWIERQLASIDHRSARSLLADRDHRRRETWDAIDAERRSTAALARRLARGWAGAARRRELLRSESTRGHAVVRRFLQRAAHLTGLGPDVYLLTLDETTSLLDGDRRPLDRLDARRSAYELHRSLPRYPTVVRGPFDPVAWAAGLPGPDRRPSTASPAITGHGGAAGTVTARARVLLDLDQADGFTAGEVLVTPLTNVGWTPLLLQAAAVVTDIGAPLSHAAIVARELGIPAVVGCGDATTRIATGDLLRVDGGRGTVEQVERRERLGAHPVPSGRAGGEGEGSAPRPEDVRDGRPSGSGQDHPGP